jgi:hypothetical protein
MVAYRVSRCLALVVTVLVAAPGIAGADCGSIPYYSPLGGFDLLDIVTTPEGTAQVEFDPLKIVVYEPGQRGIILWNGQEQILLLSTDIKTSRPISILEVIPLPAEPTVKLGDFETFQKMQALLISKKMWTVAAGGGVPDVEAPAAARITFHQQMGAHEVTVVHVEDATQFTKWVEGFLAKKQAVNPKIDPEFLNVIQRYVNRGFHWFVFDSINTRDQVQSRQPVEYRFKSDSVYYPLEISTRETGKTEVDLLVLTPKALEQVPEMQVALSRDGGMTVAAGELADVSADWARFMGGGDYAMERIRIKGNIQKMTKDFIAR